MIDNFISGVAGGILFLAGNWSFNKAKSENLIGKTYGELLNRMDNEIIVLRKDLSDNNKIVKELLKEKYDLNQMIYEFKEREIQFEKREIEFEKREVEFKKRELEFKKEKEEMIKKINHLETQLKEYFKEV